MNSEFSQKIQKLQKMTNIVDVVGQYLKLTRKGNNFWAVCPFHQDSNPSLSVSQEKQIYKCFSCGQQGNVFIFLQKYKNIDFFTAVKEVASVSKIDLKTLDLEILDQHQKIHPFKILHNLALNFYQYQITTDAGKLALEYLEKRHILKKNIDDFAIGYAPGNNQLLEYLKLQGYQESEVVAAGLAKINDKDEISDMFYNRIMFPIFDLSGECLGFSARNYLNKKELNFKYINTPETEIFKKRKILYNLYNGKKNITINNSSIFLVEGYMDVISLTNQNINNCFALMGTNLTKEQINILIKITDNIIIFLDGDEPGKLAAFKIAINLLAYNFNVKVIANHTNLDPDELINKKINEFNKIIQNPLHPLDFAIDFFLSKYDLKKDSFQLKEFLLQLKPLWQVLKDPVEVKFYLEKLKRLTSLSEKELFSVLQNNQVVKENKILVKKNNSNSKYKMILPQEKLLELQKQLFFRLLLDRNVYLFLEEKKFIFSDKRLMNLYFVVAQKYQEKSLRKIDLQELLKLLKNNDIFDFLKAIIDKYKDKNFDFNRSILEDDLVRNKEFIDKIEIEHLKKELNECNSYEAQKVILQKMSNLKK